MTFSTTTDKMLVIEECTNSKAVTIFPRSNTKTMVKIAQTQDEEVRDGATSAIKLAAEMLGEKMHPTMVIQA